MGVLQSESEGVGLVEGKPPPHHNHAAHAAGEAAAHAAGCCGPAEARTACRRPAAPNGPEVWIADTAIAGYDSDGSED